MARGGRRLWEMEESQCSRKEAQYIKDPEMEMNPENSRN